MFPIRPIAVAATVAALAAALPALAQEKEPPSPWKRLRGPLAGAVGTCPPVDGDPDGGVCYLVRCDTKLGAVFVIRDPIVGEFGVDAYKVETRGFTATIALDRRDEAEGTIALDRNPGFLAALRREAPNGVTLATAKARQSYTTAFELTGARRLIDGVLARCPKT